MNIRFLSLFLLCCHCFSKMVFFVLQIANKMLHIQTQLRNLGYQGEISLELSCNCSLDKAVENVSSFNMKFCILVLH